MSNLEPWRILMLQAYSAFLDKVDKVLFVVLASLGAAMTLIMMYQIILRYVFNSSSLWSEELTRYMFAWLVLLAAGVADRKNTHLKIDFLVDAMPLRARLIMEIASYILVLGFLLYLFSLSIQLVSHTTENISTGLLIPMAIPYFCVTIGSFLMTLSCVEYLWKRIVEFKQLSGPGRGNQGGGS
jgi:TRAP-type C4-dicarboxylate transport system permease small subunit